MKYNTVVRQGLVSFRIALVLRVSSFMNWHPFLAARCMQKKAEFLPHVHSQNRGCVPYLHDDTALPERPSYILVNYMWM